ncbi:hypothetical protein M422DRAFT_37635, partial [Sphaerobolus stellatus SS14]
MQGHTDYVWSVVFSPDGTWLMSESYSGEILFWDAYCQIQTTVPPNIHHLQITRSLVTLNTETGWVCGPGRRKLWWMPTLNRGVWCGTSDGRICTGNSNGLFTFVDGTKAFKSFILN